MAYITKIPEKYLLYGLCSAHSPSHRSGSLWVKSRANLCKSVSNRVTAAGPVQRSPTSPSQPAADTVTLFNRILSVTPVALSNSTEFTHV